MKLRLATFSVAVASLLGTHTQAACPSNPLSVLNGTTWAFSASDGVYDATIGIFTANIGVANASRSTTPQGLLSIKETYNNYGNIGNQVTGTGTYQLNSDCKSGLLIFNVEGNAFQYAFTLVNGGTEMYLASASGDVPNTGFGPYVGNHGVAKLLPGTPSCTVSNPLSALNGTWGFLTHDYEFSATGEFTPSISSMGQGALSITSTSTGWTGTVIVGQSGAGSYQVYPDCSGGEMWFQAGGNAFQYAYVWAAPNELFLLSNNPDAPNYEQGYYEYFADDDSGSSYYYFTYPVSGTAKKQ